MSSKKNPAKKESNITSSAIADQIEEFLKNGGSITKIDHGVTGNTHAPGKKHIVINKEKAQG